MSDHWSKLQRPSTPLSWTFLAPDLFLRAVIAHLVARASVPDPIVSLPRIVKDGLGVVCDLAYDEAVEVPFRFRMSTPSIRVLPSRSRAPVTVSLQYILFLPTPAFLLPTHISSLSTIPERSDGGPSSSNAALMSLFNTTSTEIDTNHFQRGRFLFSMTVPAVTEKRYLHSLHRYCLLLLIS